MSAKKLFNIVKNTGGYIYLGDQMIPWRLQNDRGLAAIILCEVEVEVEVVVCATKEWRRRYIKKSPINDWEKWAQNAHSIAWAG